MVWYNMRMPSLAVIIVNYNTRDLLAQCLSSIYANEAITLPHRSGR